ncbi:MAG TPA: UDP-N-acetylmuramoyl-L-alanyl-D-glutamate--2,6-diaminopimelate ligase [Gemmatimonadaceae bacterium]|jgi:UDP-N-acetylmuramoyl-L-alanyl-D-glutamate--2,6-diaminopimelate ligase|nr:UDP-N-acetylmuramoyl-L-alanyl-D-glutamate--2,6-diaminopimelate ligase [Gemmatimonadaceae bacterium]
MHADISTIAQALDEAGLLVERRGALTGEPNASAALTGITDDSRAVGPGFLFVAVRGSERDGHDYLDAAAKAGATAAIVQDPSRTNLPSLVVNDGRRAAAIAGAAAYGFPARELQLVGITGTNGKTTTVNMLRHLLDDPGARSASIGTLGVLIGSEGTPLEGGGGLTTPGPIELQRLFRTLHDAGVRRIAMEVSSHSLHQRRVEGVFFDVVAFTNLTRDHLDYHGTMEAYFAAKARLVDHLLPHGTVAYNIDDKAWTALKTDRRRVGFSERVKTAEVHAEDVRFGPRGSEFTLVLDRDSVTVRLPLIGDFNVINALGAAAVAYALGVPVDRIGQRLSTMPQVPGRLEVLRDGPTVLRDYAHTPDALERALDAVRPFALERLIVVFGCGGDRDRGKRPEMGGIAEGKADLAIVTSDNPRSEDPEAILDEIEGGMHRTNHERIEDRRLAIARALEIATPRDVIVLAGKGHETYQIRGTTKLPFDEKEIVGELSREAAAGVRSGGATR